MTKKLRVKFRPSARSEKLLSISSTGLFGANHKIKNISKVFDKALSSKVTFSSEIEKRHKKYGLDLWYEIELEESDISTFIQDYKDHEDIDIIEPVYEIELYDDNSVLNVTPNDSLYGMMWHLDKINIREAWQVSSGNPRVKIGLIDQGAKYDHPDLQANIGGYESFVSGKPFKGDKHGSHTGGTIAAVTNNQTGISGIAGGNGEPDSGVKLYSLQVFYDTTSGGFANAMIWAADNGMAMTSNSWGYTTAGVYEQSLLDAIDYFCEYGGGDVLHGGLVICSAGNNNHDLPHYPSAYEKCISVAATNKNDRKAFYSNYGEDVDISAPGGEMNVMPTLGILSCDQNNNYIYLQGTSMACPHVTGVAALIVSAFPGKFTAQHVRDILLLSTDNIDTVNSEFIGKLGTGRLNAGKALALAKEYSGIPEQDLLNLEISGKDILMSWEYDGDVILAVNTESFFSMPDNTMEVGDTINGNGLIIYKGRLNQFTDVNPVPGIKYYYKLWIISPEGEIASAKVKSITPQNSDLPYVKFNPNDAEDGWTKEGMTMVSPVMDLSNYETVNIVYRNYATGPAWLKNFRISRDGGNNWSVLIAPTVVNKWNYVSKTIDNLTSEMRFKWFFEDDPNAGTWDVTDFGIFDTSGNTLEIISETGGETNFKGMFNVRQNILFPLRAIYDGQRFSGWNFIQNGNNNESKLPELLFKIKGNTLVTATFNRKKLTVSRLGTGLMNIDPGIYYYDTGTKLNLVANSIEGNRDEFYGWIVNNNLIKDPSITITMDIDTRVQAKFEHKVRIITQTVGNGRILYPSQSDEIFNGDYLNISCETDDTFVEWEKWIDGNLREPSLKKTDSMKVVANDTIKLVAKFTDVPLEEKTVTMIVNGEGRSIPAAGSHVYRVGTTFSASATANSGYVFTHWDSSVYGRLESSSIYLLPNKDFDLVSNFAVKPPPITDPVWLSMVRIGKGESVPKGSTRIVQRGSTFTYLAIPDEGWEFQKWESNLFGVHEEPEVTFTVTEGSTVGSFFVRKEDSASLTITIGEGGTSNPEPGSYMYVKGDEISIKAMPFDGYEFEKWVEPYLGTFYSPSITFNIQRDLRLVAYFKEKTVEPTTHDLIVMKTGNGSVNPVPGTYTYPKDSSVELNAIPSDGWKFEKWHSPELGESFNENVNIVMDKDITMSAEFSEIPVPKYSLTLSKSGEGEITPFEGTQFYLRGEKINISAIPVNGYKFVRWDSNLGTFLNSSVEITIDQNITLNAVFEPLSVNVEISSVGNGITNPRNGIYNVQIGSIFSIDASSNDVWEFKYWIIGETYIVKTPALSMTVEKDSKIEAVFNYKFSGDEFTLEFLDSEVKINNIPKKITGTLTVK